MKKADKQKAEETVKILRDVHNTIRKTVAAGNTAASMELLEQCQACAISLGEMIEALEGEGFVTVGLLECYCELVYEIYEEIQKPGLKDGNRLHNQLAKQLIQIGKSIERDIQVRQEAVFLPYKASMWDSLESIWRAAEEDPQWDAYVIPIPYYDKKPDGSFCEMHYEGDLYPDYVPVTDYRNYDFAARRPDVIFIHNPYDGDNYVTSVTPFFYSDNLKCFTEKLVYVPYFILGDIDPENEEALENITHFCMTPGVVNADKVIVQSENMRQVYINILTKAAGDRTRRHWEEKILGLGSPKTDKVLAARKEDQEIPEDWMRIIRKQDGSWKKIILYKTSVTALLRHEEKMLRKMKDVFRIFAENRDDVALWWRPHPLIKATIGSMRPQLWGEYERIVEEYRRGGWGIYDDSAELDRAIVICDGYYGDWSSLVELCREAGKMVMIQEVENIEGDER